MNEYRDYVRRVNEVMASLRIVTADDLRRLDEQDRAAEWRRRRAELEARKRP
jgi:hypothetical protein